MTKQEYEEYEGLFADFMAREGIDILSDAHTDFIRDTEDPWLPCDCCGNTLGGTRHAMLGAKSGVGPNGQCYIVCPDCVYYAAHGRLDDTTMMEITG